MHGAALLLMVDSGKGLLVVDLEEEVVRGKLRVHLHPGYDDGGFRCCLASCGNLAVGHNADVDEWLFLGRSAEQVANAADVHGDALVVDMRAVLGSEELAAAEGEGEEQDDRQHDEQDERDFGEERPEPKVADRHRSVGVGLVATALRDGVEQRHNSQSLGGSLGWAASFGAERDERSEGATVLAIAPGWLASGYEDGTVRLQRLPAELAWAYEPGSMASALCDGARHCDRCNSYFPEDEEE